MSVYMRLCTVYRLTSGFWSVCLYVFMYPHTVTNPGGTNQAMASIQFGNRPWRLSNKKPTWHTEKHIKFPPFAESLDPPHDLVHWKISGSANVHICLISMSVLQLFLIKLSSFENNSSSKINKRINKIVTIPCAGFLQTLSMMGQVTGRPTGMCCRWLYTGVG